MMLESDQWAESLISGCEVQCSADVHRRETEKLTLHAEGYDAMLAETFKKGFVVNA